MKLIELGCASSELQEQAWRLYVDSFPAHERWSREAFARARQDERFHTEIAVSENGKLLALLYYWIYGKTLYVEFLAVEPDMRGQNTGSELIGKLIADNPGFKILLEIDPPIDEVSIRRLGFYERHGFVPNGYEHIHPSYISGEAAHPHLLIVMTHGGTITSQEFMEFRTFLLDVLERYGD